MFALAGWSRSVRLPCLGAAALAVALVAARPAHADSPPAPTAQPQSQDGDEALWAGDDAWSDPAQPAHAEPAPARSPAATYGSDPAGPPLPATRPPAPRADQWYGDTEIDGAAAGQGAAPPPGSQDGPGGAAQAGPGLADPRPPPTGPDYLPPSSTPGYGAGDSPSMASGQPQGYGGQPQDLGGYDSQAEVQASAPRYSDFQTGLSPYGMWVDTPEYGRVFRPTRVSAGWRPYLDGRWVYTRYGWTWVGDEPFGWATYHYGRWWHSDALGWSWVPGRVWAPAWVSWRYGGGNCGWAPMGPRGHVYAEPTRWVFVPSVHFVQPVRAYALPIHQTYAVWGRVAPIPMVRPGPLSGPRVTVISGAIGRPIRAVPIRLGATAGPGRVSGGGVEIFRPHGVPFRGAAVQARVRRDWQQPRAQATSPQAGQHQPSAPMQGPRAYPQAPRAATQPTPQVTAAPPHGTFQPQGPRASPQQQSPRASPQPQGPRAWPQQQSPRASPQASTPQSRWGSETPRSAPRERPQWGQQRRQQFGGPSTSGARPPAASVARPSPAYGSRPQVGTPRPTTRDRATPRAQTPERSRSSGSTAVTPKQNSRRSTDKKRD